VADLLIVFEGPGRAQVVHGNYDTYERLRAEQLAAEGPEERPSESAPKPSSNETAAKPTRRKRQFPYRRVEELEGDIAATEAMIARLESALADGDLYRDAIKVRDTMQAFEEAKARLLQLYQHWEEAVELN
jgi:ATP-binding cassette subfamily F protein 3